MTRRRRWPPTGLASRLFLAQALLLLAGAGTTWLVASVIGPGIFHSHLLEASGTTGDAQVVHVERAFGDALLVAMGVALLVSVLTALLVTGWFTRRVQRSTDAVVEATGRITAGRYDTRLPATRLGDEFDHLATTINELAQRLDATETTRTRLLSDLGHELRTPLATLEMHLEALEDGVRDLDADTLGVLWTSTGRLRRLADDITTVSRSQEGRLELRLARCDLSDLVADGVATAGDGYASKGVALVMDAPAAVWSEVDRQRVAQVLSNLLGNALRHTPPGGTVTVRTRPAGASAVIEVEDDGEGIAAEHLPHLFERFYRADASRSSRDSGSGIGLTISRAIVDAHGGELTATSPGPGQGSTFVVVLPSRP